MKLKIKVLAIALGTSMLLSGCNFNAFGKEISFKLPWEKEEPATPEVQPGTQDVNGIPSAGSSSSDDFSGLTGSGDTTQEAPSTDSSQNPEDMESIADIYTDGNTKLVIIDMVKNNMSDQLVDKQDMVRAGIIGKDGATLQEEYMPTVQEDVILRVIKSDETYKDYKITFKIDKEEANKLTYEDKHPRLYGWGAASHVWRRFVNSFNKEEGYKGEWDGVPYANGNAKMTDVKDGSTYKHQAQAEEEQEFNVVKLVAGSTAYFIRGKIGFTPVGDSSTATVTLKSGNKYTVKISSEEEIQQFLQNSPHDTSKFDEGKFVIQDENSTGISLGILSQHMVHFRQKGKEKTRPWFYDIKDNDNYIVVMPENVVKSSNKEMNLIIKNIEKGLG